MKNWLRAIKLPDYTGLAVAAAVLVGLTLFFARDMALLVFLGELIAFGIGEAEQGWRHRRGHPWCVRMRYIALEGARVVNALSREERARLDEAAAPDAWSLNDQYHRLVARRLGELHGKDAALLYEVLVRCGEWDPEAPCHERSDGSTH
jgi:hypothetical protein